MENHLRPRTNSGELETLPAVRRVGGGYLGSGEASSRRAKGGGGSGGSSRGHGVAGDGPERLLDRR